MSPADTKVLVSLIYGDSQIYTSAYQKSQIYEKAGKTVYTYCFDGHPRYDWILEYQTEYAGLGHAAELPLEFGNIDFWLYKEIYALSYMMIIRSTQTSRRAKLASYSGNPVILGSDNDRKVFKSLLANQNSGSKFENQMTR